MTTTESLEAGRAAAGRYAWSEALGLLSAADTDRGLSPDDLDLLAESAWWMGRMRDCIGFRERAQEGYLAAGDRRGAARMAFKLADHHADLVEMSVAGGWLQRGQKLLENEPDCVEHGYLHLTQAHFCHGAGDRASSLVHAEQAAEIATRFGDKDLLAFGLAAQGMTLVERGEVERGMGLLDEATMAAVSGELGPYATGLIYCMTISVCSDLADWHRAGQWTEAAKRWCDRQAISGFPGVCRVHRAEIMRLRGSLAEADEEARAATTELASFNVWASAWAFYELGEIRLHTGDLDAAEEAFRQAHELGRTPQPGLALVQLRRGKAQAAANAIKRALAEESMTPLARAKLLPAQVETSVAVGDLATARSAAAELGEIAESFSSPAMQAAAQAATAAVAFAEGDRSTAEAAAKRASRLWKQADVPYEAARACMLLGEIYAAEGDAEAAELELRSAYSVFDKLGAGPDALAASDRIKTLAPGAPAAGHRVARTFMFTDIVSSTNLVEAMGDEAWMDLLGWHDEMLRSHIRTAGGEEVDHTGDGFFVAFSTADEAIACAVAIQRALAEHRKAHGYAPQVRIGLHATEATAVEGDYRGKGVHEAARIGALADGGEVLASAATMGCVGKSVPVSEERSVTLKGVAEPVRVVSILWR